MSSRPVVAAISVVAVLAFVGPGGGATQRAQVGGLGELDVQVIGTGLVTSNPAGISCPTSCTKVFGPGTRVTLTAAPGPDAAFASWGGACEGSAPTCSVVLDTEKSVTASFKPVPTPSLSLNDVSVREGNSGTTVAALTATLSPTTSETVTVEYKTSDGTARASDYVTASGTLTFAPRAATAMVGVAIKGDAVHEPDETVFVDLSSPVNAEIARGRGVVTVVDDDPEAQSTGPYPSITADVQASWSVHRRFTRVIRLELVNVPAGAAIDVHCGGIRKSGCPFAKKRVSVHRSGSVRLTRLFGSAKLRPRTKLELRITKPGMIGRDVTFTIRAGKLPSASKRCVPPGARQPAACSA